MKILLAALVLSFAATEVEAACNRRVDPKKVVIMMAFNSVGAEEQGAIDGACARGETLVIIPKRTEAFRRQEAARNAAQGRMNILANEYTRCQTDACRTQVETRFGQIRNDEEQPSLDYKGDLQNFLEQSRANGIKVSSVILSGHDGGGHYYGDYGETTMAEISTIASENQAVFSNTTSLLLMGCWSATPDQVEQWRSIFPRVRVMGGFVGSAPSSTRAAAGTYISGLLRGEKNLLPQSSRAQVQAMINTVQHMNMVTAGVYIQPVCEDPTGRSPAYYYISPANDPSEMPEGMKPGLNSMATPDSLEASCMRAFGGENFRGTFDWNALTQYYQGDREPENNPELRGLYSFLRNNQNCFTAEHSTSPYSPDQVLMLRFFQDTKKNFNKYFKNDLEEMYRDLDAIIEASTNPRLKERYKKHQRLVGDSLLGMTRKQTLENVSGLQGIYDLAFRDRGRTSNDAKVIATMQKIDQHLYRLQCLPATWHEYNEGETLAPPACN